MRYGGEKSFDIAGDKRILLQIIDDMFENGGVLIPSEHWLAVSEINVKDGQRKFDESLYESRYSNLRLLLDPWIGCTGMQPVTDASWAEYDPYLRRIDRLGLLPSGKADDLAAKGWVNADLGTIMDLNFLDVYSQPRNRDRTLILEVGGGYGRLAEAFLATYPGQIKYVLVDAVPASVMYSYLYLSHNTNARVGFYYNNDDFNLERYDIYIIPSWHFANFNKVQYDLCINIESFQEMAQHHVDYYLELFDANTRSGGVIYVSNAHDYVFKGDWRYPPHWERLFLQNTPRSWSPDHPTEIFRKGERDYSAENNMFRLIYDENLRLKQSLAARDSEYWQAQREIVELWERLSKAVGG